MRTLHNFKTATLFKHVATKCGSDASFVNDWNISKPTSLEGNAYNTALCLMPRSDNPAAGNRVIRYDRVDLATLLRNRGPLRMHPDTRTMEEIAGAVLRCWGIYISPDNYVPIVLPEVTGFFELILKAAPDSYVAINEVWLGGSWDETMPLTTIPSEDISSFVTFVEPRLRATNL